MQNFREILERQKTYFNSNATKSYEWRIDRLVKKHPKPLSAFVFSRDQGAIDCFLNSLSFGGGAINQVNIHLFVETMPFGGVGNSGIGNYYGKCGFASMTHAKSILISLADVDIDDLLPPYSKEKVEALNQWLDY